MVYFYIEQVECCMIMVYVHEIDTSKEFLLKYKNVLKRDIEDYTKYLKYVANDILMEPLEDAVCLTSKDAFYMPFNVNKNPGKRTNSIEKQIFLDNKIESFKFIKNDF